MFLAGPGSRTRPVVMGDLPVEVDVAIIGAGAAGLGAAGRLARAEPPVLFVVLEARDRVGGRAHTLTGRSGAAIDLGCGWLHSADQNPWTQIASDLGFALDRSPPPWSRSALDANFPMAEQRAHHKAFEALESRLEAAADGPDRRASELLDPADARWNPLLNAFSGYYNGAPFDDVSVHDYAAYQPTDENWRVRRGYGALIGAFAADLPVRLGARATRLDHGGARLRIETSAGSIQARAAIVALPTGVLADGALRFDPPLPDKLEAAEALPLGHVDKAFLRMARPEAFEVDARVIGRTDTAQTGAYTLRQMGLPVVEGFFGGDLARDLEGEGPGAFCAFAIDELVAVLGSQMRAALSPIAESAWARDPFARGAYSHARPGRAGMRAVLARPVEGRIFFAGEACSPHAFSTAHGAYQTGVAAAEAAMAALDPGRRTAAPAEAGQNAG